MGLLQRCEVLLDDPKPGMDHFPIISIFDLQVPHQEATLRPDFQMVDWKAFNDKLSIHLSDFPTPAPLAMKRDFDNACTNLMEAIQDITRTTVLLKCPCPYTKHWWMADLRKLRQNMRRLYWHAHQLKDFPEHSAHEEARAARNKYSTALDKARHKHWTIGSKRSRARHMGSTSLYSEARR